MQRWPHLIASATVLALSGFVASAALAAPPVYRIEAIEAQHQARPRTALGISRNGIVTGDAWMKSRGSDSAYRFKNGVTRPLLGPDNFSAAGRRVNDGGAVVGWVGEAAWMWDSAGAGSSLDALMPCDADGDVRSSQGRDINNAGDVVLKYHCVQSGIEVSGSFLYRGGSFIDLGNLGGGFNEVNAINTSGQAAGTSSLPPDSDGNGYVHAYIWEAGSLHDLGTLGGHASTAEDINDAGHVVGSARDAANVNIGYRYDGSTMQPLPTCPGSSNSPQPRAINNRGQIVGMSLQGKNFQAFLLRKNRCYLLSSILDDSGTGWANLQPKDINDDGVIVGYGQFGGGEEKAFIATPVTP